MKFKNFAELLEYDLTNPRDLKFLQDHKFKTSEVLSLMSELLESDIDERQKNDYLRFFRSINPTSKVEWHKFSPYVKRMVAEGNSQGLLNFCTIFFKKGDNRNFLKNAPEFKDEKFVVQFLQTLLDGYYNDVEEYYGKNRKAEVANIVGFLKHLKVEIPSPAVIDSMILSCDSLKSGSRVLEFFNRQQLVRGFSPNLIIAFLTKIKKSSIENGAPDGFNFREAEEVVVYANIFEEVKIDEERLKELLKSFTSHDEFEILRFLDRNDESHAAIQELVAEELANQISAGTFGFLRTSGFHFDKEIKKDCLRKVKARDPDIYAWAIYQFYRLIDKNFDQLELNLSLGDLTALSLYFDGDNKAWQDFIDEELAKFPLEKLIEFSLEDKDELGKSFGLLIMPRAAEINLGHFNSIIEKTVNLGQTYKLKRFLSLVKDSHFADADEKKKFIEELIGKMIKANTDNPQRQPDKPFFSLHDFTNILETLIQRGSEIPVYLERNSAFTIFASLIKSCGAFMESYEPDSSLMADVSRYADLFEYSAGDFVDKEIFADLLRVVLLKKNRHGDFDIAGDRLASIVFEIAEVATTGKRFGTRYFTNPLLSQSEFREIYLQVLSEIIAEKSDAEFDAQNIRFDPNNSNFTLKEVIEATLATRDKSANPALAFAAAFKIFYSGHKFDPIEVAGRFLNLSLFVDFARLAFQPEFSEIHLSVANFFDEAVIENDLSEESDGELLLMLEKLALIEKVNLSPFYGEFFSKIFSSTNPEKKPQLEQAKARIFSKMSPALQLIFADKEMPQINYWQALKDCEKFPQSAFQAALENVARYCAAESESEIDPALLAQLVILVVQKGVGRPPYLEVFKRFGDELKTLGNDKNFQELFESLLQNPERFVEAINLLNELKIEPSFLSEILQKAEVEKIVEMIICAKTNFSGNSEAIVEILIPRISARVEERGGIILFFDVQDYLKKVGFEEDSPDWKMQKISFFNAIAPHIKIASQDNMFWEELVQDWSLEAHDFGLKKLQFILATYSEDSATSSTILKTPIDLKYERVSHKIETMMQVSALFRFYPQLMQTHVENLAAHDALIAVLNLSIKFYGAKFVALDQFHILQAIYSEREKLMALDGGAAAESSPRENIDFKQLLSCRELLAEKEKFPKRAPSEALSKTNLGKALHALKTDKSFEKFYDSLSEKNHKILNLKKVSTEEFEELESWIASQIANLNARYEALSKVQLDRSKAASDPLVRAQLQEKQALQKFLEDQEAASSIFDKMLLLKNLVSGPSMTRWEKDPSMNEFTKGAQRYKDLLNNSADVENYWAMLQNIDISHRGCWTKFCANLDNNLELCSLMSTEEELANSVSAQLGLVRQPNCYVNLQVAQQSELEARRYVRKDFAAIAMAEFQGVLPFITRDVHNYEPEKLKALHLPRNNFCYLVGEELEKIVKSSPAAALGADLLRPQRQLLQNLEDIKFITSLASADEDGIKTLRNGKEVELSQEQCVEIYQSNLKQFLVKQKIEFTPDSLEEHRESFGAFLEEQKIKMLTALGIETCKSAFSPDFYTQAFGDLSHELPTLPFDLTIPPQVETTKFSAKKLSRNPEVVQGL